MSPIEPNYARVDATVVDHRCVKGNEFEIVLRAPHIATTARPGQFVMVLYGEEWTMEHRRPFSIFRANPVTGNISILYLARGSFTAEMSQQREGDKVSLLGPLGNPFGIGTETETVIMIAGGIGAPPLCYMAHWITEQMPEKHKRIIAVLGARSADQLVGEPDLVGLGIDVRICTDDGSYGVLGNTSELLRAAIIEMEPEERYKTLVYSCGPMRMLRSVSDVCKAYAVPCQISIEVAMPCGVGECGKCSVNVRSSEGCEQQRLACVAGPVFDSEAYMWE